MQNENMYRKSEARFLFQQNNNVHSQQRPSALIPFTRHIIKKSTLETTSCFKSHLVIYFFIFYFALDGICSPALKNCHTFNWRLNQSLTYRYSKFINCWGFVILLH